MHLVLLMTGPTTPEFPMGTYLVLFSVRIGFHIGSLDLPYGTIVILHRIKRFKISYHTFGI